jgi:predicted Fe-Mo cluster-binding NifX family protein
MQAESKPLTVGKIAVGIEKPDPQSVISELFGRSKYFFLFDEKNNTEEIIANPFARTFGGAGIQTAQLLVENNVDVLITNQVGINAMRILNSAGTRVFVCIRENARTAVRLFYENKLKIIDKSEILVHGKKHRNRFGYRNQTNTNSKI